MARLIFYFTLLVVAVLIAYIPYVFIHPTGWDLISWQMSYWPGIFLITLLIALFYEYKEARKDKRQSASLDTSSNLGKVYLFIATLLLIYFTMNSLLNLQMDRVTPNDVILRLAGILFGYIVIVLLLMQRKFI